MGLQSLRQMFYVATETAMNRCAEAGTLQYHHATSRGEPTLQLPVNSFHHQEPGRAGLTLTSSSRLSRRRNMLKVEENIWGGGGKRHGGHPYAEDWTPPSPCMMTNNWITSCSLCVSASVIHLWVVQGLDCSTLSVVRLTRVLDVEYHWWYHCSLHAYDWRENLTFITTS